MERFPACALSAPASCALHLILTLNHLGGIERRLDRLEALGAHYFPTPEYVALCDERFAMLLAAELLQAALTWHQAHATSSPPELHQADDADGDECPHCGLWWQRKR